MKTLKVPIAVLLLAVAGRALTGAPARQQEADLKAKAQKWIAQADSAKVLVEGVLADAVKAGAEKHAVAKDNVVDARYWLGEAGKALKSAKEAYEAGDFKKAATMGNMAWQYYVKAGSAAVRASKLAGGGG